MQKPTGPDLFLCLSPKHAAQAVHSPCKSRPGLLNICLRSMQCTQYIIAHAKADRTFLVFFLQSTHHTTTECTTRLFKKWDEPNGRAPRASRRFLEGPKPSLHAAAANIHKKTAVNYQILYATNSIGLTQNRSQSAPTPTRY